MAAARPPLADLRRTATGGATVTLAGAAASPPVRHSPCHSVRKPPDCRSRRLHDFRGSSKTSSLGQRVAVLVADGYPVSCSGLTEKAATRPVLLCSSAAAAAPLVQLLIVPGVIIHAMGSMIPGNLPGILPCMGGSDGGPGDAAPRLGVGDDSVLWAEVSSVADGRVYLLHPCLRYEQAPWLQQACQSGTLAEDCIDACRPDLRRPRM